MIRTFLLLNPATVCHLSYLSQTLFYYPVYPNPPSRVSDFEMTLPFPSLLSWSFSNLSLSSAPTSAMPSIFSSLTAPPPHWPWIWGTTASQDLLQTCGEKQRWDAGNLGCVEHSGEAYQGNAGDTEGDHPKPRSYACLPRNEERLSPGEHTGTGRRKDS